MDDTQESARDWGRRQAASSPPWGEEKWARVARIFGTDFQPAQDPDHETSSRG